jgi:hypothetical protein
VSEQWLLHHIHVDLCLLPLIEVGCILGTELWCNTWRSSAHSALG